MLTPSIKLKRDQVEAWAAKNRKLILTSACLGDPAAKDILRLLQEQFENPNPLTEQALLIQVYEFQKGIEQ